MQSKKSKEALYYKKLRNKVQCLLCPKFCVIPDGRRGDCKTRENQNGILYSISYKKPCSIAVDPIEKKPLYHFMPGSEAYSIATAGCNLHCLFCQNYEISQKRPEEVVHYEMSPENVVKAVQELGCKIIAFTYTEPTIFYEYMLDIAKIAKKKKIKCVIVSNGFINPEPLKELCKYIDGANIDLKSMSDLFYRHYCSARLYPVLESLRILKQKNVWLEITNLIIPGKNDSENEIKKIINFVSELDVSIPLHFTAFYPSYKMLNVPRTNPETLIKARKIALKKLNYVYTGNILDEEGSTTFCPRCKKPLIVRKGFFGISENNVVNGKCKFCGQEISGVWK